MHLSLEQLEEFDRPATGLVRARTVSFVRHAPTGIRMAKRAVFISLKQYLVDKVTRQFQFLQDCRSEYTTLYYGIFSAGSHVQICSEYMDKGPLAAILKKHGPIHVAIAGKIAFAVLHGLVYLYDNHRIAHRDVKPSNILLNSKGEIKLCDFGIYSILEEYMPLPDLLDDFSIYQSPERIQNLPFTSTADTWSLGITLIEFVQGRHPYEELGLSLVELPYHIVNEPVPRVKFDDCGVRPAPKAMLKHGWILRSGKDTSVSVEAWARNV
ncbi:mitogen activated protein kinase kinase [Ceratobasidium sp. AG-Ba]|nr:mitogen activated protein kinase kinase [Ceratobasidium sp. AG-Ba]